MKSPQRKVGLHIMTTSRGRWVLIQAAIIGLTALSTTVLVRPLHSHHTPFDSKTMALRLAAIEEKNPYRLKDLRRNGRPTLIAFIDHLCYTCLRSVKDVEQLKKDFSVRANKHPLHTHEKMGMEGVFVVGKGGAPEVHEKVTQKNLYEGLGVVVAVQPRKSRIVLDHEEIKDFMAPHVMGYLVKPGSLVQGLTPGDRIRFTIDADQRAIVKISPVTFRGEGTVILADTRKSQIVVDHKEIPGFMAPKIMGYPVKPAKLLQGLEKGDKIRFTIDAEQNVIVDISRMEK